MYITYVWYHDEYVRITVILRYTKPNYDLYLELDSKYKVECSGGLWQI
jgi:hypothetical protein